MTVETNIVKNNIILKKSSGDYSSEEQQKLLNEYESFLSKEDNIKTYDVIEAKVISITNKYVILDIGSKSNGVVALSEFNDIPDLQVGTIVDVFVENIDNKTGMMSISRRKAKLVKNWKILEESAANGTPLDSYVVNRTKGGLIVQIGNIDAFLPGSQIDLKPVYDFDSYLNKHLNVIVLKINDHNNNVIVSRKLILEREIEDQNSAVMANLAVGQIIEGTVKNLTSYGAFIDIGGIDGLLYLTDISWGRVNHPSEVLEIGQKINAVIIDFDKDTKKLSLGLKQLTPNPWETLPKDLQVGSTIKGTVVNITDYGVFVEIVPGVEGLIHVSEISWTQQNININDYVKIGETINVKVLELNIENHRMALGLKQLTDNPWMQEDLGSTFTIGSKHNVEIVNIMPFGCNVKFENNIEGFLHISNMSWAHNINHPSDLFNVGDKIDVIILEFNAELCNLSVGIKQLTENPWEKYAEDFKLGSMHEGTIVKKTQKGIFVRIVHDLECFVPKSYLPKDLLVKVGDKIEIKIIEFAAEHCKLVGTHKSVHVDVKKQRPDNYIGGFMKKGNFITKASARFGDIEELINLSKNLKSKEETN